MKFDWFTKSALAVIAASLFVIAFGRSPGQRSAVAADPAAKPAGDLQDVQISALNTNPYPCFIAFNRRTGDFAWYRMDVDMIPGTNTGKATWVQLSPTGHTDSVGARPTVTAQK